MTASVLDAVHAHLAAFNARDAASCAAGFADDAVFAMAEDLVIGRRAILAAFTDSFAAPADAVLELRAAVVAGDTAACELVERITVAGRVHELALAAFYTLGRDGRFTRVKVYRESGG